MVHEIRVTSSTGPHFAAKELLDEIYNLLQINSIKDVQIIKVFRLQGLQEQHVQKVAQEILCEPFKQEYKVNSEIVASANKKIEIAYKPGVMNPEIASLLKVSKDLGITIDAIETSYEYHFFGDLTNNQLERICTRLLMNETIERVITFKPATLTNTDSFEPLVNEVKISRLTDNDLVALSKTMQLSLNLAEMRATQNYFFQEQREPTDAELETIAQTWSEHCYHKTFKANLIVEGIEKKPLFTRLKETSNKYQKNVVSAFADNAGAFQFYDDYAILAKVETHNSPSAIEPYGGAATGSGGVFRDIIGTGNGAKVIASTDMFCFAPPDLPQEKIPEGCLHPHYLLRRVVAGVRDYGNRMGIPTNNGSVHFHEDFKAKPTVIVGAYGITPTKYAKKGKPEIGDLIIVIGGRTGRDGIHGATFSSVAMTHQTMNVNASAVQIGNPIEEKRVADAILACRDANLIRAITDCGAGGLSSAIGEMGSEIGVEVYLEKVPLKYAGLEPWEIWVSESQERMVCAIASEHKEKFVQICTDWNVEAIIIGTFTRDCRLKVFYKQQTVCDLDMHFLHEGIPQKTLVATKPASKTYQQNFFPTKTSTISEIFKKVLADWNICSKEPIVRQYDHTVQGTNALLPFSGTDQAGPNDAAVLTPVLGKPYGLIIGHGINPILNRIDPYQGSLWAIVEALSNVVAVGGNITESALVDNFIWPFPDAEHLWMLDASMQACVDAMDIFKIPFISGKDSLSSTYRYKDGQVLTIPPVLCISVLSKISDVYKTVSSNFKKANSFIVLVGTLDTKNFGGSIVAQKFPENFNTEQVPSLALQQLPERFALLYELIESGAILSCHDVSEGGLAVTIAEMCFGSKYGATINLSGFEVEPANILFAETAGCLVIEIVEELLPKMMSCGLVAQIIGRTTYEQELTIVQNNKKYCTESIAELRTIWQAPMKGVFHQ